MPLPFLIPLVVGGFAGIAGTLHLSGLAAKRRFAAESEARDAWRRAVPEAEIRQVALSRDGRAALIVTKMGPGVVWAMDAGGAARLCPGARIESTRRGPVLHLSEGSTPGIPLALPKTEVGRLQAAMGEIA